MTSADNHDIGDGDEMIAAEYVLGVLPADERQGVSLRIDSDPAFAHLVSLWERRLSALAEGYQQIEVPSSIKQALNKRLFPVVEPASLNKLGFWSNVAFWRSLTAGLATAFVLYVVVPHFRPEKAPASSGLIASLAADGSNVRYLALLDRANGEVRLSHLSGDRAPARDFELWVIKNNTPTSLGVVPVGKAVSLKLPSDLWQKLSFGETFAITLEPVGGSPTGQPTGPIVAAGELKNI